MSIFSMVTCFIFVFQLTTSCLKFLFRITVPILNIGMSNHHGDRGKLLFSLSYINYKMITVLGALYYFSTNRFPGTTVVM